MVFHKHFPGCMLILINLGKIICVWYNRIHLGVLIPEIAFWNCSSFWFNDLSIIMMICSLECIFIINYLSPFMFSAVRAFCIPTHILFLWPFLLLSLNNLLCICKWDFQRHPRFIGRGFLLIATDKKDYILCCDNQSIGSSKHIYTYYAQSIKNEISRVSVSQSLINVSLSCWLWICRLCHAEEWLPLSLAWEHQSPLVVLINLYWRTPENNCEKNNFSSKDVCF